MCVCVCACVCVCVCVLDARGIQAKDIFHEATRPPCLH